MVKSEFETSRLFFGFLQDTTFKEQFLSLDPAFKSLFIQAEDSYLQEYSCKEGVFLGKCLGKKSDLPKLEALSLNIYSLLKKLVPNYPYESSKLWLITVLDE